MKKLIFLIGWGLGICLPAVQTEAQQLVVLDLEKTIRLANDSSLEAFRTQNMYLAGYWEYRTYKANRLPSLTLNMTPAQYNRDITRLSVVEKGQMPQNIAKENQQYRLCLQYEYIGSYEMGNRVQERDLEAIKKLLPMGYTAESERQTWGWGGGINKQYLLLLIVISIIFCTTSILFNSLKQPLAIIFIIPVSYIGVFLTFYWFQLNFDQGGFASFVLLCGITVNASIYILNEYNSICRRFPHMSRYYAYVKAWNAKIVPIFLTVISTVLGFIPFMVGTEKEGFWFPLAAGTIGGLVMSVIGIFFFLPLLCLKKDKSTKTVKK